MRLDENNFTIVANISNGLEDRFFINKKYFRGASTYHYTKVGTFWSSDTNRMMGTISNNTGIFIFQNGVPDVSNTNFVFSALLEDKLSKDKLTDG